MEREEERGRERKREGERGREREDEYLKIKIRRIRFRRNGYPTKKTIHPHHLQGDTERPQENPSILVLQHFFERHLSEVTSAHLKQLTAVILPNDNSSTVIWF
jgi:hypothetical protein